MPYNGASNGSGVGGAVAGSSVSGGGATIVVSEGPQNKKIRTGVQQPGENDVNMHARSTQNQSQQQALMNKSNDDLRRKRPETTRPNHILLFTIINPFYPITVDVLHKICNPHGQVLRIVIFKKNGVQAMVEFDSLDAATRARENLNGADIYAGCCTLKIDFAKPEKLNVYKNETDTSWDYTLSTVFKKVVTITTTSTTATTTTNSKQLQQEQQQLQLKINNKTRNPIPDLYIHIYSICRRPLTTTIMLMPQRCYSSFPQKPENLKTKNQKPETKIIIKENNIYKKKYIKMPACLPDYHPTN
ncbi:uncharacterized protein LOC133844720 isoform X25 [Drosophila sulfurigaster albostrigata]|uniref:uncharacterized protein LOC133844720 isoform X25 n=1 Tax=Drosophila sulfurigaster albostrigata TaxID=89887 RepID=UPI002D21E0A2|nr:uncharacterized protein LOC133844720 isoform X25 [Drosophila sulfurigaster albostrigata]